MPRLNANRITADAIAAAAAAAAASPAAGVLSGGAGNPYVNFSAVPKIGIAQPLFFEEDAR